MTRFALPIQEQQHHHVKCSNMEHRTLTIALVGNPNAGKTTLFNKLTGLHAKTANFAGTTVEHRQAKIRLADKSVTCVDLPGAYSLEATTLEQAIVSDALQGNVAQLAKPDVVVLVVNATQLERNLLLASQVLEQADRIIVALNMMDVAEQWGVEIDMAALQRHLNCPIIPISAWTGAGLLDLKQCIAQTLDDTPTLTSKKNEYACRCCTHCPYASRYHWAQCVTRACKKDASIHQALWTERFDAILTHPVLGIVSFVAIMSLFFVMIFGLAQYPMEWIESMAAWTGHWLTAHLPESILTSMVAEGFIGGAGGVLVFLPQICILFFLLTLLEDSGYLARAAFVMDRLMQHIGLPGKAFIPLLSAHACAIPAVLSTRVIESKRDRLAAIMVIPLMSCSARVPIYAMIAAMLFPTQPLYAAALFAMTYFIGIISAVGMSFLLKRTFLQGAVQPLVIELPDYRLPSLVNALLVMRDRAWLFTRNVGMIILPLSVLLWTAATFPQLPEDQIPQSVAHQIAQLELAGDLDAAAQLHAQEALAYSTVGRLGRAIQPVFEPLGFDWKISVGILTSFAAREMVVSTLAILYGMDSDASEETPTTFFEALRTATHADGSMVFTAATSVSFLLFFALAMQCLPTSVATRLESGSWKWPILQIVMMTSFAYLIAMVGYQLVTFVGLS